MNLAPISQGGNVATMVPCCVKQTAETMVPSTSSFVEAFLLACLTEFVFAGRQVTRFESLPLRISQNCTYGDHSSRKLNNNKCRIRSLRLTSLSEYVVVYSWATCYLLQEILALVLYDVMPNSYHTHCKLIKYSLHHSVFGHPTTMSPATNSCLEMYSIPIPAVLTLLGG